MNNDRVSELYYGELSTERSQRICRDRIHWLCAEARGRVLDVGSSQGITSILLGRAAHDVVGIEIETRAIEFARRELAKETAEVQRRVRFVHADAHGDALDGETFDTVVLGEVLEHLADPRALWLAVAKRVAPNGRLIGTTPFGLFPHHDHKVTFYYRSFLDTIAGVGRLVHLDVHDGYIRFIVSTAPDAVAIELDAMTLLAMSEQAFLAVQTELDESHRERKQLLARANVERDEALAKARTQERALETARNQARDAQAEASRARTSLETLRARLRDVERFRVPPDDATPTVRGLSALLGSLQRELHGGGLRAPVQALRKTYGRVRTALRGPNGG